MKSKEFILLRKRLEKTQRQLARLLGVSLKTVQSYEQGWRVVPDHVAKQMLLLVTGAASGGGQSPACWDVVGCPPEKKEDCPAWEFQQGHLCWFLNGTACEKEAGESWQEKLLRCRECQVLSDLITSGQEK